jgi:septal ring factor EnvC (AmiA/AmiB activator)
VKELKENQELIETSSREKSQSALELNEQKARLEKKLEEKKRQVLELEEKLSKHETSTIQLRQDYSQVPLLFFFNPQALNETKYKNTSTKMQQTK